MATRILHVEANEDGTVGGTHRALEDLVLRVNRSKFEPVVLFYQDNVHVRTLRAHGIEVQLYDVERARERAIRQHGGRVRKLWDILGAITRRRRFLLANRIDLVHLNNSPKSGYDDWLPAARLIGIPFISFAMGDPILEPRIIRLAARRMDHVIAISDYMKAAMLRAGIREDRLTRVYLGVDAAALRAAVQRPAAATRSALGVPEDAVHVVMVGNIRRWKGQYVLLDALSAMPARTRERIHVSFVGAATVHDGEYQAELEALARASGSGNRVRFLGARNDVPTLLASADIAVHASVKKEPFGLVVPEAMAQGVAVVASKFGGPGEVIDPESHPPPRARDPGRVRYRAESPVDPETVRTGRRATTGAGGGPPGPLSITPTSQRPDDARGRSACAQAPVGLILTFLLPRPPTSTADRTPREARPQGGGHAAARPAALARSSITPYTRPTPIEIPIPSADRAPSQRRVVRA